MAVVRCRRHRLLVEVIVSMTSLNILYEFYDAGAALVESKLKFPSTNFHASSPSRSVKLGIQ
jgi:hypothetical protein